MVFKVKERANKDYDMYKRRQIERTVKNETYSKQEQQGDLQFPGLSIYPEGPQFSEIFGYNWPYDDFSLFESVKIDVGVEVEK